MGMCVCVYMCVCSSGYNYSSGTEYEFDHSDTLNYKVMHPIQWH